MMTPEDAIRARRRLTNKIIAAHDAPRLRPFPDPAVKLIAGDGGLIQGVDQVVQAFAAQFQDPGFVTYIRETDTVTVDQDGARRRNRALDGTLGRLSRRSCPAPTWQAGAECSASG